MMNFYFSFGQGSIESTLRWDYCSFDTPSCFFETIRLDVLNAAKNLTCFDDAVCLANEANDKAEAWLVGEFARLLWDMQEVDS